MKIKYFYTLLVSLIVFEAGFATAQEFASRFSNQITTSNEANTHRGNDVRLDCRKAVQQTYLLGSTFNIPELEPLLVPVSQFNNLEIVGKHWWNV